MENSTATVSELKSTRFSSLLVNLKLNLKCVKKEAGKNAETKPFLFFLIFPTTIPAEKTTNIVSGPIPVSTLESECLIYSTVLNPLSNERHLC